MTPGVVNVLLDYVLKVNNQKLSKNYIDTIAGQLNRLHVETVEEAMRVTEKEHKKLKKQFETKTTKQVIKPKVERKEQLPDWFNKELKNEVMTDDDKEELDKLLSSIDEEIESI